MTKRVRWRGPARRARRLEARRVEIIQRFLAGLITVDSDLEAAIKKAYGLPEVTR